MRITTKEIDRITLVNEAMKCNCGGTLTFKHENDGLLTAGFTHCYKCNKCGVIHFFKTN